MTYIKKIWQSGDIISANNLNNIEEGIPEIFIIKCTDSSTKISTNYDSLKNAVVNKKIIIGKYYDSVSGNQSFTFFNKIIINDDRTFKLDNDIYDENGNNTTADHFR